MGPPYRCWGIGIQRFHDLARTGGYLVRALVVSYPNNTNLQLTVGADGKGGIMLVWRTASSEFPGIYWMWSTDYGESWSSPQTLPEIVSRNIDNPFDVYDMATDSAVIFIWWLSGIWVDRPTRGWVCQVSITLSGWDQLVRAYVGIQE